jgi:4-amino-4-deoxy-L-arabinose transferase-like glycosyltransferase
VRESRTQHHHRLAALGAFALVAIVYLAGIGGYPLQDPDEGRYAEIPREMIETGDWVTPRLNYVQYFEKPPLLYWLVASSFEVFGMTEGAARAVPACSGLLTIVVTYLLGARLFGRRAALFGAGALATSPLFFGLSQGLTIDALLTAGVTLTLASVWAAHDAQHKTTWALLVALGAALAVLAKGPIGLVLPGLIALPFLLCVRDVATIRALLGFGPLALFGIVAVPWFVLVARANPEFLHFFFIREHVGRFASTVGHPEGPFYYVPPLLTAALPWTAVAAALSVGRAGRRAFGAIPREPRLFLLLWAGVTIAFFSLASSKLVPYILPALPPLGLLAGAWIDRVIDQEELGETVVRWLGVAFVATGALILVASAITWAYDARLAAWLAEDAADVRTVAVAARAVGLTLLVSGVVAAPRGSVSSPGPSGRLGILGAGMALALLAGVSGRNIVTTSRELGNAIQQHRRPGDLLVSYNKFMQGLGFYTQSRITMVRGFHEIDDSRSWDPAYQTFLWNNPKRLAREWSSDRRVLLATEQENLRRLKRLLEPDPRIVVRNRRRVLLANFPPEKALP